MLIENWNRLRDERRAHGGTFAWFIQCREHGQDFKAFCMSCGMCEEHNAKIWRELAEKMGWLLDEPAGDVPIRV